MRQGKNSPKSGTMAPMTTADSSRQRASKREKGSTTAAWEMVNGINDLGCHLTSYYRSINRGLAPND